MIKFEVTGLDRIRADLGRALTQAPVNTRKAVEVTARKVKDDARRRAEGIGPHAKDYPRSISYDLTSATPLLVEAEIGPDKGGPQGALGNLLEYGSSKNAPIPHLGPALEANAEDFENGIEIATRGLL